MAEFRTDPGDRGVTELERDVTSERERVSATIDELRSRASVESIVDQVVKSVAENGGDVSRNLGRSLRDNPLAAIVTGVGLAWLMAGSGRPAERDRWDEAPDRLDHERDDVYAMYDRGRFGTEDRALETDDDSVGLGERVSDAAGRIGDAVSGAAEGLRDGAAGAAHSASGAVHRAGDAVRRRTAATSRGAARQGANLQDGLETLMRDQPLVLGAIAMALGAAVGGTLPRSRIEDRAMGAASDRAKGAVRAAAEETGAEVQAAAGAMAEEALDIADETAAEMGGALPSGDELVAGVEDRVRNAGARLRDAAEREGDPKRVNR